MSQASLPALRQMFDVLPVGIVMMDRSGEVLLYNRYEEELAGRSRKDVVGRRFFTDVAPCIEVAGLGDYYRESIGRRPLDRSLSFRFPRPCVRRARDVHLSLFSMRYEEEDYGLLLVEDVSAIRAVERTKDFLVRMLAHDMRNPLTTLTFALQDGLGKALDREARAAADSAVRRLNGMICNLNAITRLHTDDVPLQIRPTDVARLCSEAAETCEPQARARNVNLQVERVLDRLEADLDAELVRRALINLLENAVRHSPEGGTIRLACGAVGDRVQFEVRDEGSGVDPEIRGRLFEPFVSKPPEAADATRHQGLGLAFTDLVAREHAGTIDVDCPPEGGSIFRLAIPVKPPHRE